MKLIPFPTVIQLECGRASSDLMPSELMCVFLPWQEAQMWSSVSVFHQSKFPEKLDPISFTCDMGFPDLPHLPPPMEITTSPQSLSDSLSTLNTLSNGNFRASVWRLTF
jgi:hypothetical protein